MKTDFDSCLGAKVSNPQPVKQVITLREPYLCCFIQLYIYSSVGLNIQTQHLLLDYNHDADCILDLTENQVDNSGSKHSIYSKGTAPPHMYAV